MKECNVKLWNHSTNSGDQLFLCCGVACAIFCCCRSCGPRKKSPEHTLARYYSFWCCHRDHWVRHTNAHFDYLFRRSIRQWPRHTHTNTRPYVAWSAFESEKMKRISVATGNAETALETWCGHHVCDGEFFFATFDNDFPFFRNSHRTKRGNSKRIYLIRATHTQ